MTEFQFITLCNENLIYPALALENENILQALKNKDNELVKKIILKEF